MTLDQYQLCPCGSGKKIKFCCSKDLIHDLDRILRMVEGEQRLAAVEKIDSLLDKHPEKPSLLMLKAELLMQMNELDKAREIVRRVGEIAPRNPSVVAMQAILTLGIDHNLSQAISYVQDAFETVDGIVTPRMYEALVLIATMLFRMGRPAASKGHLQLALALSDAKDERSAQLLMQINQHRQIPLLMREPLALHDCPDNVTWRIEFNVAMREIYRGRWRRGAQQLHAMSIRILDAPAILYNLGVVQTWLANNKEAAYAFRQFARIREVPLDDRVHAMALAEVLDASLGRYSSEIIERVYEIERVDTLMEQCLSNPRLSQVEIDPEQLPEGQPAPRGAFEVLDKPELKGTEWSKLTADDVPLLQGAVLLFGKETDRPARLVIHTVRSRADGIAQLAAELLGSELPAPAGENVVNHAQWLSVEVLQEPRIPAQAPPVERQRLQREIQKQAILQRWPRTPAPMLDGKTPLEVAESGKDKITLLSMLLNLEIVAQDANWDVDLNEVRTLLGLEPEGPLALDNVNFERLPVHRLSRVDVAKLNDEQLLTIYRRSYAVMAVSSLRRIAQEVISRPSLNERIDKVEAYDILSDVALNTDEALMYLDQARKLATSEGESPAAWLLDEMEIRLLRGEGDKFLQLLKEIQTRYMNEPGISNALLDLLSRYGLVTPDGRLRIPRPQEAAMSEPEPAAASSGVWTPDGGSAAAQGEGQSESKLWIPGMD